MITKTIVSGIWRLGRGTATIMGLAILLALTMGLASTALAGTGIGARLDLGRVNVINNATTTLKGSGPGGVVSSSLLEVKREGSTGIGAALRVDNTSTADAARGIDINVPNGEMPINVNSGAGKADLNVDRLDGKDSTAFVDPTKIYSNVAQRKNDVAGEGAGPIAHRSVSCDPGDVALGGGGFTSDVQDTLVSSSADGSDGWRVLFQDGGNVSTIGAEVRCADLPPLR